MYSVNKGADQQCCHRTADLHLCFRTHLKQVFSWCDSFSTIPTLLGPIILSVMNLRLRMLLLFFFWLFIYPFIYSFYLFYFIFYYFYFYVFFNYLLIYLSLFLN